MMIPTTENATLVREQHASGYIWRLWKDTRSDDGIKYLYILTISSELGAQSLISISAETSRQIEYLCKKKDLDFAPMLCALYSGAHINLGVDGACSDINVFAEKARELAIGILENTEPDNPSL